MRELEATSRLLPIPASPTSKTDLAFAVEQTPAKASSSACSSASLPIIGAPVSPVVRSPVLETGSSARQTATGSALPLATT